MKNGTIFLLRFLLLAACAIVNIVASIIMMVLTNGKVIPPILSFYSAIYINIILRMHIILAYLMALSA